MTILRPTYDVGEFVEDVTTASEALQQLGSTTLVQGVNAFGATPVQPLIYPLTQARQDEKDSILGVQKHE